MKPGKIVLTHTTAKNLPITIRYPLKSDAPAMCDYINTLSLEKTFISFQGETMTLEDEIKYLDKSIEELGKNKKVQLLVFHQNLLIGVSDISMRDKIDRHIGVFGITIRKEYRNQGIGSLLAKTIISEATKNISGLEIITLGVFATNPIAQAMYQKLGFQEYGNLPQGIKLENSNVDHIFMYKKI